MTPPGDVSRDYAALGERMARVETRLDPIESTLTEVRTEQTAASMQRAKDHGEVMAALTAGGVRMTEIEKRMDVLSDAQAGIPAALKSAIAAVPPGIWWATVGILATSVAGAVGIAYTAPPPPASITITQTAPAPDAHQEPAP
jgi:hypothetical protein